MGSLADHQNAAMAGNGSIADKEIAYWAAGGSGGGGAHPDLAAHDALGLVTDAEGLHKSGNEVKNGFLQLNDRLGVGQAPVAGVPMVVSKPGGLVDGDMVQFIGGVRDPGTGKRYRMVIMGDPHLHMNTAMSLNGKEWQGADGSIPPLATHDGRPAMIAVTNDTGGPSYYCQGNDTGPYLEFFNNSGQLKVQVDRAPASGGGGVWLGIGDAPISTLTLSDKDDAANLPAMTLRHAGATARLAVTGTGTIELSSNWKLAENAFGEWAITMGLNTDDIRFLRAPTPGGARAEITRIGYAGLRMASGKTLEMGAAGESRMYDDGTFVVITSHNMVVSTGALNALFITNSTGAVQAGADFGVTGKFGANGTAPVGKQSLGAAAVDAATTQTLANNLRAALIAIGLGVT